MMHDHDPAQESRPGAGRPDRPETDEGGQPQASHSMWWMVACCAPMVLIGLPILLGLFGPR